MNKTKVKKYKVVLRDVSANFVSAEKFIKGSTEETYVLKKKYPWKRIYFLLFMKPYVFSVMVGCLLSFSINNSFLL